MAAGLDRVLTGTPGRGYLEAQAGWRSHGGVYARGELGQNFTSRLGAFAFGEWTPAATMAGVGLRATW